MSMLCSGSSLSSRARFASVAMIPSSSARKRSKLARKIALVLEVIEETAFRDPGRLHQFLDGRRREALLGNGIVGNVEEALARSLAFRLHGRFQLYRRSSFFDQLVDHRAPPLLA